MKLIFLLLTAFICLVNGLSNGKYSGSKKCNQATLGIVNGKKSSIKKFPFMASLSVEGSLWGSGVIINKHWILTTAFNVKWTPQSDLQFRVGSNSYSKGGQALQVEKVICHENYTGSWDFDVAVVKVNKPIKFGKKVKAVHVGTKELKAKSKAAIAGWGSTTAGGQPSTTLLSSHVTVFSREKCKESYPYDLTPRLMCTFNANTGPCSDDFGDPLIVHNAVYGLYAGGENCLKDPALYTDVADLHKWISAAIKHN